MTMFVYVITPLVFVLCLGLTIGLTYAPCYSALCVEEYYPYETRLHIAYFYSLVAVCAIGLTARALSERCRRISEYHLTEQPIPGLKKRLTVGGVTLFLWLALITLSTTGIWWESQYDFYQQRGLAVDYTVGVLRLAAVGITGHWCDILTGLLILPISRGSTLGKFFRLHTSTLLFAHKILAYGLLLVVAIRMTVFYSWVPTFAKAPTTEQKLAFNIDNPTMSIPETEERSYYYNTMMPSGMVAFVTFLVIAITSLPKLRRTHYNAFYYTHIAASVFFFIMISFHASTDFYFILPGLVLWVLDWAARLRWLLRLNIKAVVRHAGNDWFEITLPGWTPTTHTAVETANPLQTYYLNFPSVSKAQCHAFTVASIGSKDESPVFIFRKSSGKVSRKLEKEWTWAVSDLTKDCEGSQTLDARLEGPYSPPVPELFKAHQILCVVGGTGITGALSIAEWWLSQPSRSGCGRFKLIWTVRTEDMSRLHHIEALIDRTKGRDNFSIQIHISGNGGGRLDVPGSISTFFDAGSAVHSTTEKVASADLSHGLVYCSGPGGLLESADTACIKYEKGLKEMHRSSTASQTPLKKLSWYVAKWDV